MSRRNPSVHQPAADDTEAALDAMSADELRGLVRLLLLELDGPAYGRALQALVNGAARSDSRPAPAGPNEAEVAAVVAFATDAKEAGSADPDEVDAYLRRGSDAFQRRAYGAVLRIFGALLRPLGEGAIDLGQHELLDEVLDTDLAACAAKGVVAAYMLSPPEQRAERVYAAIGDAGSVGHFWAPLEELERVAVEPLPLFDDFLHDWRALLVRRPVDPPGDERDSDEDGWLREVVLRLEGPAGLAGIARATGRDEDLRAWCQSLVDAGDWGGALPAFEEAAGLVERGSYVQGELLDGAALAAQELGRGDLPDRLERAWRAAPSLARLRRWLGTAGSSAALRKRAAEALDACPKAEARQRALLQLLRGDLGAAAKLLSAAPGGGWSSPEHPGGLLFPWFAGLLGAGPTRLADLRTGEAFDLDELVQYMAKLGVPRLVTPKIEQLLCTAGVDSPPTAATRRALLAAMRTAAERRLEGVKAGKHRNQYRQAAALVAACVACDPSRRSTAWAASLRSDQRRFPSLCAALTEALGAA